MDPDRLPAGGADEGPTMRLARLIASAGAAEDRLRSLLDGLPAEGTARWVRLMNASAEAAELESVREEMRSLVGEWVPGWQRLVERLEAEMGAKDLDAPGQSDGLIAEIEARVRRIAAIARGEIPCPSSDALRRIADGAADAPAIARAALATAEIRFSRWYD